MRPPAGACAGALALAALLALAGCASVPPYAAPLSRGAAPTPRRAPEPDSVPVPAGPAPQTAAARADSTPSRDALEVLATIPEPLTPAERVAPPDVAPAAAEDDSGGADVPVPATTPVLGARTLPEVVAPADTTPPPVSPAARALADPPPAPGRGVPAAADTCWRVQIAASAERAKSERYLEAGRSQLFTPLQVESEKGLFKVRTRDCMNGPAADGLRRRALDAGFDGAFRFREKRP